MSENAVTDVWNLIVHEREMKELKQELMKEMRKVAREEFAKEQEAYISEQRAVLDRLNAAVEEAERCAVRYQDNLDKFLRG